MIFVTSLFNLPFLMLIWLIEAYLFLALTRLILGSLPQCRQSHGYQQIRLLTDLLIAPIHRKLVTLAGNPVPFWVPWAVVILLLCLTLQILVWIIIG
jgi:uncharacterized protein YggT (Ycf19 family)